MSKADIAALILAIGSVTFAILAVMYAIAGDIKAALVHGMLAVIFLPAAEIVAAL